MVEGVSLQELSLGVGAQVSEREGECSMGRHLNEQEPARMPLTRAPYTLLLSLPRRIHEKIFPYRLVSSNLPFWEAAQRSDFACSSVPDVSTPTKSLV